MNDGVDRVSHACNSFGLLKVGHSTVKTLMLLRLLKVNEHYVYHVKKFFKETDDVCDHLQAGQPPRMKNVVNAVRIRNPCHKRKIPSQGINLSLRTILCVLTEDLGLQAYKRYTRHLLNACLSRLQFKRSKKLLGVNRKNLFKKFLFKDENIFTTEQKFKKQNDKVCARTSYEAKAKAPGIQRGHHSSSVMVWWGVLLNGVCVIHFCIPVVKTTIKIQEEIVLEPVVKPLNETLFKKQRWIFQQDATPTHKSERCHEWLANNIRAFDQAEDWASGSPNLNPLDDELWYSLEQNDCGYVVGIVKVNKKWRMSLFHIL